MRELELPEVVFTVGCPGSGKTTWALEYSARTGAAMLSLDGCRDLVCGAKANYYDPVTFKPKSETLLSAVHAVHLGALSSMLDRGLSVVIHNTHIKSSSFLPEWQAVLQRGIHPKIAVFEVPLEFLLFRNEKRPEVDWVPEEVIRSMHEEFCANGAWWTASSLRSYRLRTSRP